MSCNNQLQIHWSGTSFFTATAFFSNAALTTPAPDGFYAFGGFVREILNGVLLSAIPCESCVIPCGSPFNFGGGATGEYNIQFGMGTDPGAAIVTFSPGVNNSTYFPVPDQCTWTYVAPSNPYGELKRSEYSQLTGGYLKGLIGAFDSPTYASGNNCLSQQNPVGPLITSQAGTVNSQSIGSVFTFVPNAANPNGGAFNNTTPNAPLGNTLTPPPIGWTGLFNNAGDYQSTLLNWNCSNKSSPNCSCTTDINACNSSLGVPSSPYNDNLPIAPNLQSFSAGGTTRWNAVGLSIKPAVMVVPSPPGIPTTNLQISVVGPCTSTWWGINVQCPVLLTAIPSSTQFGDLENDQTPAGQLTKTPLSDVCKYTIDRFFYHVPVDNWGNSNPNSYYYNPGDTFPETPTSTPPGPGPTGQPPGVLGLSDWIYEDPYGVTPVAVGVYKMQFDALDGLGVRTWAVQVGPREYKDLSTNGGTSPQLNPLPPEDYVGQVWSPDWAAGITASDVQSTGDRIPGIVRSITPCYAVSFDCDPTTGLCSDPGTGLGQYTSLAACQAACKPPVSFDCVNNACVDPGTGNGQYATLAACQAVCNPPAPCGSSFTPGANLNVGQFNITLDGGTDTGAFIIRFLPYSVPDRCTWTYDGVSASEYSSATEGYLQGLIGTIGGGGGTGGGQIFPTCLASGGIITNTNGSNGVQYNGFSYNWDPNTSTFVLGASVTMGPYTNQASGGVTLTANAPGFSMMVVPKPNATPGLMQMQLDGPCGQTGFQIEAYCPVKLSRKDRGVINGSCQTYTTNFYTASPHTNTGLSPNNLQVHDWVFEDENGVTALPAGNYPARFPGGPHKIMTVSSNGVITALVACP